MAINAAANCSTCGMKCRARGAWYGPRHPQRRHVLLEQELLIHRVVVVMPAVRVRGPAVSTSSTSVTLRHDTVCTPHRPEHRLRGVGPHERRRVAQVGDVIRGDSTDVHPGGAHHRQQRTGQPELAAPDRGFPGPRPRPANPTIPDE